jgi:hypothetical protein
MFITRAILAVGVSIVALLISLTLDRILAPLTIFPQFIIQIPLLVLLMETVRQTALIYLPRTHGMTIDEINGAFFFAAPLAAAAATDLMGEIRRTLY